MSNSASSNHEDYTKTCFNCSEDREFDRAKIKFIGGGVVGTNEKKQMTHTAIVIIYLFILARFYLLVACMQTHSWIHDLRFREWGNVNTAADLVLLIRKMKTIKKRDYTKYIIYSPVKTVHHFVHYCCSLAHARPRSCQVDKNGCWIQPPAKQVSSWLSLFSLKRPTFARPKVLLVFFLLIGLQLLPRKLYSRF